MRVGPIECASRSVETTLVSTRSANKWPQDLVTVRGSWAPQLLTGVPAISTLKFHGSTFQFRLTNETESSRVAAENSSDPDGYVQQLVEHYLDHDAWFRQNVKKGLEQLDRSECLTHEEVGERIERMFVKWRFAGHRKQLTTLLPPLHISGKEHISGRTILPPRIALPRDLRARGAPSPHSICKDTTVESRHPTDEDASTLRRVFGNRD